MGKNWSKGLTAATDARVARDAAAHRRRGRYRTRRNALRGEIPWSVPMAYALGLTATDGCLSRDRRHIYFDSKDRSLVATYLRCIGRTDVKIVRRLTRAGGWCYRAAFSDTGLYDWFLARGILPAKSLTLAAVDVVDELYPHLLRGLLDGDGTIYVRWQRPTVRSAPRYRYLRLWTYFATASPSHARWLSLTLRERLGLSSFIERQQRKDGRVLYRVRLGKRHSIALLSLLYSDSGSPALQRKRAIWTRYQSTRPR